MISRTGSLLVVGVASLGIVAGCGGSEGGAAGGESQTVKLAHKYPTTHYLHEVAEGIASDIEEGTDGRITVDIFPAEQLIPEAEEISSVASGAVHIAWPSSSEWHDFDIPASITSLPFALNSFAQSGRLRGSEFEELFTGHVESVTDVEVTGYVEGAGVDVLVTKDAPLESPDDFQGLTLRSNTADAGALFAEYGAPALTQPISDVYTSLERGTIDGANTVIPSLVAAKWYEAAPNVTITPGWLGYAMYPMIVNREWYEGLDDADREAVQEAFDNAVEEGQKLAEEEHAEGLAFLEDQPEVTVYKVPPGELESWAAPGEFLYEEFREKWGAEGEELLDAYLAAREE